MFTVLNKYKQRGQFYFQIGESLADAAKDVPTDKSGIYLVYETRNEKLIYIGSSGKILQEGGMKVRSGGMKDRIVKGIQFEQARHISWSSQMRKDKFNQLLIKWLVTFDEYNKHIPASIEGKLMQEYFDLKKELPFWNREY